MEFREALEKAHGEARTVFVRTHVIEGKDQDVSVTAAEIAFLKALEASGWKLVGPEPTEKMIRDGISKANGFAAAGNKMCNALRASHAAAPTVSDLLGEK